MSIPGPSSPPAVLTQTLPKALGAKARKVLDTLFNQFVPACLRFVRKELKELSPSEDSGLVNTAMRIITSCLDDFQPGGGRS